MTCSGKRYRNIIGVKDVSPPRRYLSELLVGQMYRYVDPWSLDNIYMRIEGIHNQNAVPVVHLNTGNVHYVSTDREVVPLKHDDTITINPPV